jgi:hypothetical protein
MKKSTFRHVWAGLVAGALICATHANDRRFTYTYEPEVLPAGAREFEQWITLRAGRTGGGTVQKDRYRRWQLRQELEYGVTDRYTVSLYLHGNAESFRDVRVRPPADRSTFRFAGVSVENRYLVFNPVEHPVGLALYLEPRLASDEAELEGKLILGQRHGDWKWALNLTHATEWEDNFHEVEGELEVSAGVARDLSPRWSLGLELREHVKLPRFRHRESSALFLGPVVSHRREKMWATLTVLPQIAGRHFRGNPGGHSRLELAGHERWNVRLLVGFDL